MINLDEKIYWYEALILLLTYVCYVVFMKFNGQVETFVKTKIVLKFQRNTNRVVSSAAIVAVEPLTRKGSPVRRFRNDSFIPICKFPPIISNRLAVVLQQLVGSMDFTTLLEYMAVRYSGRESLI